MHEVTEGVREKFAPIADLGVLTVVKELHLETFHQENENLFWSFEAAVSNVNFKPPSRICAPGDRFHVRAFAQVAPGKTTARERMEFCRQLEGNVFVGDRGIPLVFHKRELLPRGLWYASFDEEDRLWLDRRGCRSVSNLVLLSDDELCDFDTHCIERPLDETYAFFSFFDVGRLSA